MCFFFKHMTAYELRISDWSSDVCSSDLLYRRPGVRRPSHRAGVSVGWARGASFEDAPAPPPEPCLHLSMHTALRSAGHPATMMGNVAFVAQNDSPAPPRRFLPWFHLVARLVLQPVRVMHLERTISVAARFALSSAQACGEVVRTLREARADRDFIDNGVIPCLHDQMLPPPPLMAARFTSYPG